MTSERQITANRINAKKSTGPKTSLGKSRASANSARHGLGGANFGDNGLAEVERLAKAICNGESDPFRYEQALIIAKSQILLARIRAARITAIERTRDLPSAIEGQPLISKVLSNHASEASDSADRPPGEVLDEVKCFILSLPELLSLERYERRALSPRKRAIRRFDALGD